MSERQNAEGLLFDESMSKQIYSKFKHEIVSLIWNGAGSLKRFFPDLEDTEETLVELSVVEAIF